ANTCARSWRRPAASSWRKPSRRATRASPCARGGSPRPYETALRLTVVVRVLTGGTGFIGRHLLAELVKRDGEVHVLVREQSKARLKDLAQKTPGARRKVKALVGDITQAGLGLPKDQLKELRGAEVFHLAAVYDMEASKEANDRANVDGTRN